MGGLVAIIYPDPKIMGIHPLNKLDIFERQPFEDVSPIKYP